MCVAQQKSKCSREQEKEEKPLKETLCLTSPQIVPSVIPVVLTSLPPCLSSAQPPVVMAVLRMQDVGSLTQGGGDQETACWQASW